MYDKPRLIEFGRVGDSSLGYITIAECEKNVPFAINRVYWTYFTPNEVQRGGHAHKHLEQFIFAVSGRIDFYTETLDGVKEHFVLDRPDLGLYIPKLIWREIQFSHSAVLMCLASLKYDEAEYIRSYHDFINLS